MLIKRPNPFELPTREITDESLYASRRDFLRKTGQASLGLAALAAGSACFSSDDANAASDVPLTRELEGVKPAPPDYRVPDDSTSWKDATSYNNFYEFGTGKDDPARYAWKLQPEPWTVEISGEVAKPGKIGVDRLMATHDLEERIYRFRCVEAWSMVIPWVGIPLGEILKRFDPTSKAKYVEFETLVDPEQMPGQRRAILDWPYREGLRMDEAMNPLTILAVGMYGRVLPNQNGAPLRLIVPWKYGFKSIKSIVKIHLRETQGRTTWNDSAPSEYGFYANVNPEVSHPRWSQARERRIGEFRKRPTLPFNGYGEQVASLYRGMDPRKLF